MTTITKERLLTIRQWRETYGPGSNVVLPAEEAEKLARIALASLEAKPIGAFHIAEQQVDGTSDYIKDGEYRLLTSEEQKIAQLLGDAWDLYFTLPVEHPMGRDEFCRAIHHCQNMVLARPAIRALASKGQGYK